MPNEIMGERLKLWTPAIYRIQVMGHLDKSWSDRLGGMHITTRKRGDQSTVTSLNGRLKDQTELAGILNSLYELHLPILLVEHQDGSDNGQGK